MVYIISLRLLNYESSIEEKFSINSIFKNFKINLFQIYSKLIICLIYSRFDNNKVIYDLAR